MKAFAPFVREKTRRKGGKGRAEEAVGVANNALDALSFLYGKGKNDGISAPVGEEIRETVWRKSWSFSEGFSPGAGAESATVVGPSGGVRGKGGDLSPYKAAVKSLLDGGDFEYCVPAVMRKVAISACIANRTNTPSFVRT